MLRIFMFIPIAILGALALGAAATVYVDGGVNQEGFDYDLTCTRNAQIHWLDRWKDFNDSEHLAGGFYKVGVKVFVDDDCEGQSVKLVITGGHDKDSHDTLAGPFMGVIDENGVAQFPLDPPIPVWKVQDVHLLVYTDCNFEQPKDECPH